MTLHCEVKAELAAANHDIELDTMMGSLCLLSDSGYADAFSATEYLRDSFSLSHQEANAVYCFWKSSFCHA